jgi:hypothetical protein
VVEDLRLDINLKVPQGRDYWAKAFALEKYGNQDNRATKMIIIDNQDNRQATESITKHASVEHSPVPDASDHSNEFRRCAMSCRRRSYKAASSSAMNVSRKQKFQTFSGQSEHLMNHSHSKPLGLQVYTKI